MGQNPSREASRAEGSGSTHNRRPSAAAAGTSAPVIHPRRHYRDPDPATILAFHEREAARRAERGPGGRSDGPNRSFFSLGGIGTSGNSSNNAGGEHKRETKQEREARRVERERAARAKERERSMKEEHVDGGFLVTQGVYIGPEDYGKAIVRQLMIERRVAPFWRGLDDHSKTWTEYQLVAAGRGQPIPAADEIPPEDLIPRPKSKGQGQGDENQSSTNLTVPISERSQSYTSDTSTASRARLNLPPLSSSQPSSPGPSSTFPLRARTKSTLASLTGNSPGSQDLTPQEIQLPDDRFVDGLPIEAYLYRNASECPICFLYYPPYLNSTRCCDQPICSECFVQIKRPDPHPPEHGDPSEARPPAEPVTQIENQLVCEPAACPFCVTPEFGVTYNPPPFRRGLAYAGRPTAAAEQSSATATTSDAAETLSQELSSGQSTPQRRRATSLAVNAPSVITTDRVRPDWATKLATARSQAARRSAAATALHTAAYLMGGMGESRFSGFGRRARRDGTGLSIPGSSRDLLTPQRDLSGTPGDQADRSQNEGDGEGGHHEARRTRMDDLDDMMMAEAIRLSLASEEERKRKEEKDAKKEAKKEAKLNKKEAKHQAKDGKESKGFLRTLSGRPVTEGDPSRLAGNSSATSIAESQHSHKDAGQPDRKGKEAVRSDAGEEDQAPNIGGQLPQVEPMDPMSFEFDDTAPKVGSHLRQVSNVSSPSSSILETGEASHESPATTRSDGAAAGEEPLFNFRSLASIITDEEKAGEAKHLENTGVKNTDPPAQQESLEDPFSDAAEAPAPEPEATSKS